MNDQVTSLRFEVPPLGVVAPELFEQPRLWDEGPSPGETSFELLGAALNDIASRRKGSGRFDTGLLTRISRFKKLLKRGIDRITLPDAALPVVGRVDDAVVTAAADLVALTPAPRRTRVAGRLDLMGMSEALLKIEVRPGQVVTAVWDGDEPVEARRELLNRDIVLEGLAVFRPSGALLRIDADAIRPATAADDFFRQVPVGSAGHDIKRLMRLRPGERSVYAHILASIPAEETEDEFRAAVEALG